ncbi:hypothetical protein [Prevotella sp. HUN102]|jgi:hypothetical protein|uniref:hypothetical protein n=1 Tax=Prevotella sp. HUN102 TaxID=1392486 RepID=UPI00048DBA8B|nr:hypothetical protein [Prevotella sp. HUN102]
MDSQKMIQWIATHHVGISSKTMWSALMQVEIDPNVSYDIPYDVDDFSRCYDLYRFAKLDLNDLRKIEKVFPYWKPIIDVWSNLATAYIGLCYKRVNEILDSTRDEVMRLKGYKKVSQNSWVKEVQV